ncbi:DUF4163 domain-containing protein [Odoribacter lunatus]|uniref:DUF4163 domain-containing protein n=1 Tax=Odoribacter lunatus TaxID=2941335 RepID=UPI00203E45EF|nr:DUF4163 domain-containing protein [Odoribacter lunatus]
MKGYIFFITGIILLFATCKHVEKTKLDVQIYRQVDSTDYLNVIIEQSIFASGNLQLEKSCEVLNKEIKNRIDSLKKNLQEKAGVFFSEIRKEGIERPQWNFELYVRDSVFMANSEYISLRMMVYIFEGGAHGMTQFYAYNYDVKQQKLLNPQQILDFGKSKEINELLERNFVNTDSCFTEIPTLENGVSALNMNMEIFCFTYPQYALGSYSCGYLEVNIPRVELKEELILK